MTLDRDGIRRIVAEVVKRKVAPPGGVAPRRAAAGDEVSFRGRGLITEDDVMAAHQARRSLVVAPGTVVTPLARDAITRYGVPVEESGAGDAAALARVRAEAGSGSCKKGRVAIGSDHGGFEMKRFLVEFLEGEAGIPCEDLGTHTGDPVDYPDYARKVAETVARGACCRGIVVDGAGIGSAMTANKVNGIRAAHCSSVVEARNAREHNDANVLCLGGRMIGTEMAKAIAVVFLKTDFGGGRHQKRIDKMMDLERR